MAKKNLAEILVDTLVLAGVKRVYGVAGDSLNGITDVKCAKAGGKYVLYNAAAKKAYALDDQTKPEQFAGQ